jgi:hypothetical protein
MTQQYSNIPMAGGGGTVNTYPDASMDQGAVADTGNTYPDASMDQGVGIDQSVGDMSPGAGSVDSGQNVQNPPSSMSGGDIYGSDEEGENDSTGDWQTCQPGEDDGLFSKIKCYINKKYTKYSALSKSEFSKTKSADVLQRLSNFIRSYLSKFSIIKTIVIAFLLYIIALALISMHTPNKIDTITHADIIFVNRCIYAWLYILIFFCVIGLFYHFV